MSIKIATPSGIFDLPKDYSIEIEDTSPIYNDRGSQSIAATLPTTKTNIGLVNHINRIDTDQAPIADARVNISDGAYHRTGKMNITQASHSGGIVSNIGFDESEIYTIWNAVSLQSLKDLPVYKAQDNTKGIIAYMNEIMLEKRTDTPLHIFPICVSMPSKTENNNEKYYPEYLNQILLQNNNYILNAEARTETYLINNEPIVTSLPAGYGITPFLKVSWILDTLFAYYGYKVTENPFSVHPQLSRLVVLNNVADCCVKGAINYADLMPDCTINEFLQALYCRFGMLYFVDGKTKSVRLKFLKDIITTPASQDWSSLKASHPIINYNASKQLKLTAATNISGPYQYVVAAPLAESFDKFLKPYNHIVAESYETGYLSYSPHYGTFNVNRIHNGKPEIVSTDFFAWDKGDNIGYEEISSVDECLPLKRGTELGSFCPAYLLGKVHRYTNIASADIELSEEQNTQTPLCFCFSMPISSVRKPFGSPRCYGTGGIDKVTDSNGHTFDISMTFVGENGLFNRFWKEYDAILRHANHTIETELHLNHNQLLNSDFATPIGIDGQRMLIDSFRYTLPLRPTYPATVNMRTLKLLKPYDLEKEQTIHFVKQLYKWVMFNNRESVTNSVISNQVKSWQSGIRPPTIWLGVNRKNEVSDSVSEAEIPFTVPTKEDFDSQHTPFIKSINYSFDLYYKIRVLDRITSTGVAIYRDEEYGGVHYDIKYNVHIKVDKL